MLTSSSANLSPDATSREGPGRGSRWLGLFTQRALEERRVRASTLEAYTLDLEKLSRWAAAQRKDLLGLDAGDLARYVNERVEQGTPPSTLCRHLSSCRRFYAFLNSEGVLPDNPIAGIASPRLTRQEPRLVPDDVLGQLLRPVLLRKNASPAAAYRAQRDHTILWMLYATRLGISDVRLLRWPQIDEQWQVVRVPRRSGGARSFALDGRLLGALTELRDQVATAGFDQTDSAYCFPTASGLPMTRQALCHVVRKLGQECGASSGVTPSALRQTGRAHAARQQLLRPSRAAA